MAKLNQIIAIVGGEKTKAAQAITSAHHGWKKELISGIGRTYQPKDDDGERFPNEHKPVQVRVSDVLGALMDKMARFFDLCATQDYANTNAKANVVVDDKVLLADAPVSFLLFLEKQMTDLRTLCEGLPTLPSDQSWRFDEGKNCYVTEPVQSVKTQKVPTTHVKFEPTEHQPGQAEIIMVDTAIGHWTTTYMSGAIPAMDRDEIVARIEDVQRALKMAREEANQEDTIDQKGLTKPIIDYVFGK